MIKGQTYKGTDHQAWKETYMMECLEVCRHLI